MTELLITVGFIWLIWKLVEEASWNTNAYDDTGIDVNKQFQDVCVKGISKSEYKRNYRNGKYKKDK